MLIITNHRGTFNLVNTFNEVVTFSCLFPYTVLWSQCLYNAKLCIQFWFQPFYKPNRNGPNGGYSISHRKNDVAKGFPIQMITLRSNWNCWNVLHYKWNGKYSKCVYASNSPNWGNITDCRIYTISFVFHERN